MLRLEIGTPVSTTYSQLHEQKKRLLFTFTVFMKQPRAIENKKTSENKSWIEIYPVTANTYYCIFQI